MILYLLNHEKLIYKFIEISQYETNLIVSQIFSEGVLPFIMRRRQFPVKVAFAMTINKAQGQSFQKVGIYLSKPVFGHGQLYVAMSRAGIAANTKLFVENVPNTQGKFHDCQGTLTKNVVYHEVLTE